MERRGLLTATNLPRLANEKVKSVRGTRHLLRVNPKRPVTTIRVHPSPPRKARPGAGDRVTVPVHGVAMSLEWRSPARHVGHRLALVHTVYGLSPILSN